MLQIVACNATFTVSASSSMPVSFLPATLVVMCNETVVLARQCLIPSFLLALNSSAVFSRLDVNLRASSATLVYDNNAFTVAFGPLCDIGFFVVNASSKSSGVCSKCSSGAYSNVSDALVCSTCPAGSAPFNGTSCKSCANNTYTPNSGLSSCIMCPLNFFAASWRTECFTFEFVAIPPTVIASNSDIQLPCVRVTSNIGGVLNATVAQGIRIEISLFPKLVLGSQIMPDVIKVTLQNTTIACQAATAKVNPLSIAALMKSKYAWTLRLDESSNSISLLSSTADEKLAVLPYNVTVLSAPPLVQSASTLFFDFIGGTVITLNGKGLNVDPDAPSIGSSQCLFTSGSRNISVPGKVLDLLGEKFECGGTAVDENTLESGGLFGSPFQRWNVAVALSDGRRAVSNLIIQTQCKNATRYLNSSQLCSRCPANSFSTQPDAFSCICAKGSFGKHPVCRRCPQVVGFDCNRDNMTNIGKF